MQKIMAEVAKHKGMVAAAAAGVGLILYLKSKTQATQSTSQGASSTATTTPLIYPASAQATIPAAAQSSGAQSMTYGTQIAQIEAAIEGLYAQQSAQAQGTSATGGTANTAPMAQSGAPVTLPMGGNTQPTMRSRVLDASGQVRASRTNGTTVSSPSYKKAVDSAGGYFHNHVFQAGGYEGNDFVPKAVKRQVSQADVQNTKGQVRASRTNGTTVSSPSYKKAVDSAGGYFHNHVFQAGSYNGNKFVARPAAAGGDKQNAEAYVPRSGHARLVP